MPGTSPAPPAVPPAGVVRTRFAPSPTGAFHIGNARSALYNWLFARQHGGVFVLRIEDTDRARHQEAAVAGIQEALRWLGLDWDEGPWRQSQRLERYREAAWQLYAEGKAYWCDLSPEEVQARARADGRPGYGGWSRDRGLGPGPGRVLRFRVPEGRTTVRDLVRGEVTFEHEHLEDFVLLRSDGLPTFLLAVTVDDASMRITHVIRGEEHLPNTPKQLLLWKALGAGQPPAFAHLPLLVNERRQKLSKRRDRVALEGFQARGFLPEALVNYLALLGWAPRDGRELLTREELVRAFRLEEVNASPAFFDEAKLVAINAHYLRRLPCERFVALSEPFLPRGGTWSAIEPLAPLVQERARTLADVAGLVDFCFVPDEALPADQAAWAQLAAEPVTRGVLAAVLRAYQAVAWSPGALHEATRQVAEAQGVPLRKAQAPIRLAVTGRTVGPPLFESLAVLGPERVRRRLLRALGWLEGRSAEVTEPRRGGLGGGGH